MDDPAPIFIFLFIGLLFAFPFFYFIIYEPLRIFLRWFILVSFIELELDKAEYLEKNFPFYRSLLPELKRRFEKRVASFLHNKRFVGIDVEVTDEMKLFVASAAIQLTFGLRNFWLTEFDEIRLHKESYSLKNIDQKALGHVSRKGTISLSWSDLQQGFENPEDALNVGLHEMAHALYVSSVEKGWNLGFAIEYRDWEKQAIIEWKKGKSGQRSMRNYAYGNLYEFFAVSVEYFFEQPVALRAAAPQLYLDLEKLLRLDPMNHSDPILHGAPVLYPSQPIPFPQYKPDTLFAHVFSSGRNVFYFLSGSLCWVIAIILIYESVQFNDHFPDKDNPFDPWVVVATALLFMGGFLFIQMFGEDKKELQAALNPSQSAPAPKQSVSWLRMIFENPKNFLNFIIGTVSFGAGIYLIFKTLQFESWYPNNTWNPYTGYAKLSAFMFFIGMFFYIQVFYTGRKRGTK